MKISLSWLKEFVAYAGTVEELVDVLTRAGLEVESVETKGADFPKVVVAQILESSQHPNADRLSVCRVEDGSGVPRQIVCGAKNYKVGDKVPLAQPGAVLPGDFKIKVGKLRGVESEGMLCSAKELRLAEDADGLLILPPGTQVGAPIAEVFPPETVLEIEITPNRPDWLSHAGLAREVAANAGLEFKAPSVATPPTREDATVARIDDATGCPFYSVRAIRGVKIGPSPDWLQRRLESIGLRPINNVVDVTNFVMMELGQPLHAFDAAKMSGAIVVRRAAEQEKFLALDDCEYVLRDSDLVIADANGAIALAGVMGGELSGVTEATADILLESAYFDAPGVRFTARHHELHSDSSYRFERGVDPAGVLRASARASELIVQLAGGVAEEVVVMAGVLPPAEWTVPLRHERCRALLGVDLSAGEIDGTLARLGLAKISGDDVSSEWSVPSSRSDLTREVDLVEEVIRLLGIERVEGRVGGEPAPSSMEDGAYDGARALRQTLRGLGFSEARTSTLVAYSAADASRCLSLKNPLGDEQSTLRPSLLGGLLDAVRRNLDFGAGAVRLFEIGRVFAANGEEEVSHLAMVATGSCTPRSWRSAPDAPMDLFHLKGLIEKLAPEVVFAPATHPAFALALEIRIGGFIAGVLGQLSPAAARELRARGPVAAAELRVDVLQTARQVKVFVPISKFPAVTRDFASIAPRELPYAEISRVLAAAQEPLLVAVEPFDVFTDDSGSRLPADRKSLAFSLTFRSPERTLTTEEVNASCDRLKARLRAELAIDFRE